MSRLGLNPLIAESRSAVNLSIAVFRSAINALIAVSRLGLDLLIAVCLFADESIDSTVSIKERSIDNRDPSLGPRSAIAVSRSNTSVLISVYRRHRRCHYQCIGLSVAGLRSPPRGRAATFKSVDVPGSEVEGDHLRVFSDKPIITGSLVCELCEFLFVTEDDFARHKQQDHAGEAEHRKRVLVVQSGL